MKIGHSYDVHKLINNKKLILGGIKIEHLKGAQGHSDADVLLHVIAESMIGAMGLGDLGKFFPDNDPKYKDISSKILLSEINDRLIKEKYFINNIDTTIYLETPKLQQYIPLMKKEIANILNIKEEKINIKATTGEKIGIIGREEGIAAEAVILISKEEN